MTYTALPGPEEGSGGSQGVCWGGVWGEWLLSQVTSCQDTLQKSDFLRTRLKVKCVTDSQQLQQKCLKLAKTLKKNKKNPIPADTSPKSPLFPPMLSSHCWD